MIIRIFKFSFVILLIFFFFACSYKSTRDKDEISDTNKITKVKFDTLYHDFGTIIQGESLAFTYKFKNVGSSNLIIKDAISSCGCTVPNYSKKPIKPGERGKVEVIFDSAGRFGNQYKSVILKLNTLYGEKTLSFKANIVNN